jgi:deazaflavin-dependent oxidoreductase (nitroreductase family)
MSLDRIQATQPTQPTYPTTAVRLGSRFSVPRGLIAGTLAATALVWGQYEFLPGSSRLSALVQSGVYVGLILLTVCSRRAKVLLIRVLQRYLLNPLFRLLLLVGVNPYGLAILETRGRVSGKIRRVPVGNGRNGRNGREFWIIAEHGRRAGWVHNIRHDPRVRIRLRVGLRYRWLDGIATVRPDEDALARQRKIIAWHPLRALNAINVRVAGVDLLAVHVQLQVAGTSQDQARPGQENAHSRENRVSNEPEKV